FPELCGNGVADRIRNVQSSCAGLDHRFKHLEKKLGLSAGRVFRREFDVIAKRACQADRFSSLVDALLARDSQLVLQVDVRSREKHVYARTYRSPQSLGSTFNVMARGTS